MINGICFKNAVISGANNLTKSKEYVNKLNIFPVPDGDTGTNMSMTINSAVNEIINEDNENIFEVSKKVASSMLRGARGNSGVILSILFRGISKGLEGLDSVDGASIVNALKLGVDAAYKAVMKPTEGTMLTVVRIAYEKGREAAFFNNDPIFVWEAICKGAKEALETTPELLPVLKKAGVVDAGGKGVCLIFDGMLSVFKHGEIISNNVFELPNQKENETSEFSQLIAQFDDDINFTYCTELIITKSQNVDISVDTLRKFLEQIGDCVVVVEDDEFIKVHVHTEEPGTVLQKALSFGELTTVKVENMKEQNRQRKASNRKLEIQPKEPVDEVGFIAVASGDGIKSLFYDLGCLHVVTGGQTMNPSTEDIIEAILSTPAKNVFVFPNNKNIILAAEQAIPFVKDRKVIVIPTKTVPQGISALLAYDIDNTINENQILMEEAMYKVSTGQITFASRNSEFGGFKIKTGDILALDNGKLAFTSKDYIKAVTKLAAAMSNKNTSVITLIYGNGVTKEEAQIALERVHSKVGNHVDVTLINGGQPVYYFVISVE